jgi:hypothetical protein
MTLGEQLEELRFNILRDRSDLIAGDTDSLWDDDTLLRYIGDAERRFARQALVLRDATTPEVARVRLRAGVPLYALHAAVIAVMSARYPAPGATPYDLKRAGHALIAPAGPPEQLWFDPAEPFATTLPPGPPLAYQTDETLVVDRKSRVTLSVYPVPSAAEDGQILALRTIRVPMTKYGKSCLARESEIPEDYQLDVLEWAAYRAQRTFDGDAGASTLAAQHKSAFDEAVLAAKRETKRRVFATIAIRYGGNGWAWSR